MLIVAGALLLGDAATTLLWQEPVSAIYARFEQDKLGEQLTKLWDEPPRLEARALAAIDDEGGRLAFQSRALRRRVKSGQPIGRIRMKRLGTSQVIVQGTDGASLRRGPGHYPDTPLPGAPGTTAIAGHRTTYGAPFRTIDRLRKGDEIEVEMPYGVFNYAVERTQIVAPTAVEVTRRVSYDRLVLSACHPLYSAKQRIIVFARLVGGKPSDGLI